MSKVRSGPLTPCPSPSRGEGSFFIRMRSAPPLPFRERGLGGEGCPATTRLCTCPDQRGAESLNVLGCVLCYNQARLPHESGEQDRGLCA